MLSNPPYGKTWKIDQESIVDAKSKEILDYRFKSTGVPRVSDGQLLFLMNMVSKMKTNNELGSRIASVHNGSSLFTGEAGSGESEIRKYIIENDLLEAIIQLPNDMFYNTGISTYIWILNNVKETNRKGKVQLIDASEIYSKMRKGFGSKSNELLEQHIQQISNTFIDFKETDTSRIFDNDDFAYWSINVERPLRLSWQLAEERLVDIDNADSFKPVLYHLKTKLNKEVNQDYNLLVAALDKSLLELSLKWKPKERKVFLDAVSWKDEEAEPVIKKKEKGKIEYEPDVELRDYEYVPVKQDIQEYFEKEVWPFVPDAWIDHSKTTKGYEISFTKIFYQYYPLRSVFEITNEIKQLEKETEGLLTQIIS